MPRQKITEYRAKKLILGESYKGVSVSSTNQKLPTSGRYVVKVDQGVKRRFKQGLVALDHMPNAIGKLLKSWQGRGYSQFLIEPFLVHKSSEEHYLSLELVRAGIRILFAASGGIDIESRLETIKTFTIKKPGDVSAAAKQMNLPLPVFQHLLEVFDQNYFAFLEINPLVIRGKTVHLLDAAVMVDSASAFFVGDAWSEDDVVSGNKHHQAEANVQALAKTTAASLKLTVLNPNGSLFFLLSGGGGSIVIADQVALRGFGSHIGNYGEYSGGPTREETHLYAREVIQLLINSKAKKKALIIAGGIANFTDVKATFAGIIDALDEVAVRLKKMNVKVFIRRGGPNEVEGLAEMNVFLKRVGLLGSVHGSEAVITAAVDDAIDYLKL